MKPAKTSLRSIRGAVCPVPKVSSYFRFKGYIDRFVAFVLLVPAVPIIGILMFLVKLTSKGEAIYKQERLGKDGKPFTIYKIRSMVVDAEKTSGAVWATQGDPRVTRLGRFLRKVHLDELPQLFNVLKGDMALVGPRPERQKFVDIFEHEIEGYSYRMSVLPGVTGFAQLNLPADLEIDDVRRKIVLDFEYIENASFWFDFVIIIGTLGRFAKFLEKSLLHFLGIHRNVDDSPWAYYVGATDHVPTQEMSLAQLYEVASADRY